MEKEESPKIRKLYPDELIRPRVAKPATAKLMSNARMYKPPSTRPNPLQTHWADYIHRVKVHELLRVLEHEQKKLKILREHTDLNELLLGISSGHSKTQDPNQILFMKTLEEEKKSAESLVDEVREAEKDRQFMAKSALKLFHTKLTITDEQFEQILELCNDKCEQKILREAFIEKRNREKYLHNASERRRMLYEFINSQMFNRFMLFLIALSTSIIITLTFEFIAIRWAFYLLITDAIIIGIFAVEAGCKISIYREDYFQNFWNLLDISIITTHFVDVGVDLVTRILALDTDINRTFVFKFLKSLRSLRLLRAIKFLPNLQVVVTTIFHSMLSLGSIFVLMALFIFVFAVLGRGLFADENQIYFKDIGNSILTLFQLLTLDDWMDLLPDDDPNFVVKFFYLFAYIVIEYFVFLNLFVAVLVDNFQIALEEASCGEKAKSIDFNDPDALGLESEDEEGANINTWDSSTTHNHGLDLNVEEYFPVEKDSPEAKLIAENMKLLASIDFEHFMWNRRVQLAGIVMDAATASRQNTWNVYDSESFGN